MRGARGKQDNRFEREISEVELACHFALCAGRHVVFYCPKVSISLLILTLILSIYFKVMYRVCACDCYEA